MKTLLLFLFLVSVSFSNGVKADPVEGQSIVTVPDSVPANSGFCAACAAKNKVSLTDDTAAAPEANATQVPVKPAIGVAK